MSEHEALLLDVYRDVIELETKNAELRKRIALALSGKGEATKLEGLLGRRPK